MKKKVIRAWALMTNRKRFVSWNPGYCYRDWAITPRVSKEYRNEETESNKWVKIEISFPKSNHGKKA